MFKFPFVKEVFIDENYVSITKYDISDWSEITIELRTFIKEFIENGGTAVDESKIVSHPKVDKQKIENFMIDISGELLVKGQKSPSNAWVIGIEKPVKEKGAAIQVALKIRDHSIATSGNYRQFFEENGLRKSHIIDPRTGRPVEHQIASATVIGKTALETDAWGTALMVLGLEGIQIADQQQLKVMLLEAIKPGEYREVSNKLMKEYVKDNQVSIE